MKTISLYLVGGLLIALSMSLSAATIDLHIMAGQSNMQGWRSDANAYPADPRQFDSKIPFYFEAVDYSSSQRFWDNMRPQEGHFLKAISDLRLLLRALLKSLDLILLSLNLVSAVAALRRCGSHRGKTAYTTE